MVNTKKVFGALFFLSAYLLLLGDSFGFPASSLKYLSIDSRLIYYLFILTQILFSFLSLKLLPGKLIKLNNYIIFPFSALSFVFFALLNGFTYQHYVFNNFSMNLENYKYLFFISGFVLMANINAPWLKTRLQKLLYFGGVIYIVAFSFLITFSDPVFRFFIREDGVLENIQLIFYLIAAVLALKCALHLYKNSRNPAFLFFLFLALGLIFISGEEVSWGQRIFNIQTPEEFAKMNLQQETTVHNIEFFQSRIDYLYMLLGLGGAFSGLIAKRLLPKVYKKYFFIFPPAILFFYFFAVTRYYFLNKFVVFNYELFSFEKVGIGDRQEISETLLAFGFACFTFFALRALKNRDSLKLF